MCNLMHVAAKEARNENMDIKRQVRHIGNAFYSIEVSAKEAVYLVLRIPLINSTRQKCLSILPCQANFYSSLNQKVFWMKCLIIQMIL